MTSASGRFGRYKDEKLVAVRPAKIKADPALEKILHAWEKHKKAKEYGESDELIMKLRYRARHVTEFCLLAAGLAQPESPYSFGVFLNSLIKYGRDSEYYLPLMHLPFEIRLLGNNTAGKNIVIDGGSVSDIGIGMWGGRIEARGARVGDLGRILSGGEIVIDGDAAEPIGGKMGSGRIVVKGNVRPNPLKTYQESAFDEVSAGFGTGFLMTGGTIIIEGNALADIGHWMKGGEIHIGRGFESIGDVKAGKIYHKGKLIVDK